MSLPLQEYKRVNWVLKRLDEAVAREWIRQLYEKAKQEGLKLPWEASDSEPIKTLTVGELKELVRVIVREELAKEEVS